MVTVRVSGEKVVCGEVVWSGGSYVQMYRDCRTTTTTTGGPAKTSLWGRNEEARGQSSYEGSGRVVEEQREAASLSLTGRSRTAFPVFQGQLELQKHQDLPLNTEGSADSCWPIRTRYSAQRPVRSVSVAVRVCVCVCLRGLTVGKSFH